MYEIVFEPSDLNMLAAIGIIEKAKLFPYLLSMGDLRHPVIPVTVVSNL